MRRCVAASGACIPKLNGFVAARVEEMPGGADGHAKLTDSQSAADTKIATGSVSPNIVQGSSALPKKVGQACRSAVS